MPDRALPDWISGYMEATENSEPPVLFRQWCAVSVVAACLQRKCYFRLGTEVTYPNIYVVLVGPTACGKGTAMSVALELLQAKGIRTCAESIIREKLIQDLAKAQELHIDQDGNHHTHCSMTIFSPELAVFLNKKDTRIVPDLTDWYDCRAPWRYSTKHQGEDEIVAVWVNMLGATTPELIQTSLPFDAAVGGGLTGRMIFVCADKKNKVVPVPIRTEREEAVYNALRLDLDNINALAGQFRMTEECLKLWIEWYTDYGNNMPFSDYRMAGYNGRRPTHLKKLAIIMSASRSDERVITKEDWNKAQDLLTATEQHMMVAFRGVGKNITADTMARVMTYMAVRGQVTLSELVGQFYYDVSKNQTQEILETLDTMKYIKREFNGSTIMYKWIGPKKEGG